MSKAKVLGVLDKKINSADAESNKQLKDFTKSGANMKEFLNNYIQKRKEFHKYNIFKVKVSQS